MKVWMVRGGREGKMESLALDKGVSVIGWGKLPDASKVSSREAIVKLQRENYPEQSDAQVRAGASQFWTFHSKIEIGDIVVMPLKTQHTIAIGKVQGKYEYRTDLGQYHHARAVNWIHTDLPRSTFKEDLLHSLGAAMTVCRIERNDAERRIQEIMDGKPDPGFQTKEPGAGKGNYGLIEEGPLNVERTAQDQLMNFIEQNFLEHDFARLVEGVLQAEGYSTEFSPPGPDGGVDILAGKGVLGFDAPRMCVQVKSGKNEMGASEIRELQGVMQNFQADYGLFVSWGGFNKAARREARQKHFSIRLWNSGEFVEVLLRNYAKLPEDLKAELPLKQIWTLVIEDEEEER